MLSPFSSSVVFNLVWDSFCPSFLGYFRYCIGSDTITYARGVSKGHKVAQSWIYPTENIYRMFYFLFVSLYENVTVSV